MTDLNETQTQRVVNTCSTQEENQQFIPKQAVHLIN